MKFIGNIVCTIAILAQVLLSARVIMHAPDCASAQPIPVTDQHISFENSSHNCHCDHPHVAIHENIAETDPCIAKLPAPTHPCTCSSQETYPYVLDNLIIDQKSKNQLLDCGIITSTEIDFIQHSLLLCKSNPSIGPPPQLAYLPRHDTRFTSIYLGVFLL